MSKIRKRAEIARKAKSTFQKKRKLLELKYDSIKFCPFWFYVLRAILWLEVHSAVIEARKRG